VEKRASIYACSNSIAVHFLNYLKGLRQENRLPGYVYDEIPIFTKREFVDHRYDVYVSLGDSKFIYYVHIRDDKFERFKDISAE
jgi:hypothetical protein